MKETKWNMKNKGKNLSKKVGMECEGTEEVNYGRNWGVIEQNSTASRFHTTLYPTSYCDRTAILSKKKVLTIIS